ncbi:Spc7 kinetochore protein [Rutstroemia sp. NJR-2017a WRK4]|nr:Spc7 kinetochore protein [Rutstroemia sp. NJR-2017a WRK4]
MSSLEEVTLPATRRPKSRKSLAEIPDQENMTAELGALTGKRATADKPAKKSRSKSIGPGGLDALKDTAGNRRKSLAAIPQPAPRSILKPTMPPLRDIPAHNPNKRSSPRKSKTPTPPGPPSDLLIDFSVDTSAKISGAETLPNPFHIDLTPSNGESRVSLKTEEEQQAASREREEKERAAMQKEVDARRDARRKSLANRRVSFAPEATLHTWDVVVEYQDSTVSSNSTNSTRRASNVTEGSVGTPHEQKAGPLSSDPSEPPSTPPEQVEDDATATSPEHQRDLHQQKHRRSSGIPPMNFNNPDDDAFSSSPLSGSSVGDGDEVIEDDFGSNSDSEDDDDGTNMSIDGAETTSMSMASVQSSPGSDSNTRLEESLRQAQRQAGTRNEDVDENGDTKMSEDGEVIASFAPWAKKPAQEAQQDQENLYPALPQAEPDAQSESDQGGEMTIDMDMTQAVGGILPSQQREEDELSMDVTRAFGGIIANQTQTTQGRRKSMPTGLRRSTRRKSSGEDSSMGDETMDLTTAVGGIQPVEGELSEDEDMSMEFTSAIGGVLPELAAARSKKRLSVAPGSNIRRTRQSLESTAGDDTMEMTTAVGGIMPAPMDSPSDTDTTVGMEITTALGGILPPNLIPGDRAQAKKIMEMETDMGSSPFRVDAESDSPAKATPTPNATTIASDSGSPSVFALGGKGLRKSTDRKSTTPKSKLSTPLKKPTTPKKQITPQPPRPTTPSKTPPTKNVVVRTGSPKKLFKPDLKQASTTPRSSASKKNTPNKLFSQDVSTGIALPSFVLTPQRRLSSGIGIDRAGLGSPKVAALLDRRVSIGEQARSFTPSQPEDLARGVRFEDPRAMEDEIDKERAQEQDRENGRKILEREADQGEEERDATLNLKEMISSLTPKKKSMKARKSLHVGAAVGLLGKRPAELDDDSSDDESGMKRLKNHQGSPVKNVRLQGPPSKEQTTTGRLTRSGRKSLDEATNATDATITPTIASFPDKNDLTTPRDQARFKDVEAGATEPVVIPFKETTPIMEPEIVEENLEDDRIQLQDFLNMTSIRFMELTTTKRRHTIAPKRASDGQPRNRNSDQGKPSLEDCVATGAATIPMLELFQHACHELKSYISEGRKTVREIETETFEENPPLFREYISAPPDIKAVMDNQLKNVKTHSRLLSKGMWYQWRSTLLETLKDGLIRSAEGMINDEEVLDQQQTLLDSVLPEMIKQAEQLQREEAGLKAAAEDIASCDPEELSDARQQLISVEADIEAKKGLVAELKKQLQAKESELEVGTARKQICVEEIREAEKVRQECRGWTSSEISALKAKVDAIEKKHGWTITGVSGTTTSMTYRKQIELVFDASSFKSNASATTSKPVNTRIDLWYIAANRENNPLPLTPEKEFLLQCIRDHIRSYPQSQTEIKTLLNAVSSAWNKTSRVADDLELLNIICPTETTKTSDTSILVKSMLLIAPLTTKVEIALNLKCQSSEDSFVIEIDPSAKVVYGERFNEPKMREFLLNRLGNHVEEKGQGSSVSWGDAVAELGDKLLARGRK